MGFPGTSENADGGAPELDLEEAGEAVTVDWTLSHKQAVTAGVDTVFSFIAPPVAGSDLTLRIRRGATSPTALYFPSSCRWPGGFSPVFDFSGPDNIQLVRIYYDGVSYHCRTVAGLKKLPPGVNLAGYSETRISFGYPSLSLNAGTGPSRIAFLVFNEVYNTFIGPVGSISFAGQPMTRLVPPSDDYRGLQVFFQVNPPSGLGFFTFTGFSTAGYLLQAFVLTGINQANPVETDDSRVVADDYANPFHIGTIPPSSGSDRFFLNIASSFNGAYGGPYSPVDGQTVKIFEQAFPGPEHYRRQICGLLGPINPPGYRETVWQGLSGFGTRIERRILLNPA